MFYTMDTTPGNSGSSVAVIDRAWAEKAKAKEFPNGHYAYSTMVKATIGIHTGAA